MAAALVLAASLPGKAQAVTETPVEAEVENGPLRGTLLAPDGAAKAAIVIIPGSGPTDRDGNNPLGVDASYLKMLAEALAARSVASIRVDKRGMFGSRGTFPDPNAVTFDDYAADALAWVAVAKEKARVDCVWLAGHSEGGLVALVAAQEAGAALCGLVLLAAPGRKMGVVLAEQLRANPANAAILDEALDAIASLERGERVDAAGLDPSLQGLFFSPAIQDFLIDAFARDPAALIADVTLPVLIVQGEADLQVNAADAEALARAQPGAKHVVLPGMNHVLKAVPEGDTAANLAAYGDPSLPLAPGLADAVADFILRER
jgi:pimeloyl-ACP methyl ester carboxylesterase